MNLLIISTVYLGHESAASGSDGATGAEIRVQVTILGER